MNYDYIHNYTEDEFEDIQSHYDGKAEYDNGLIFLSSTTSIKLRSQVHAQCIARYIKNLLVCFVSLLNDTVSICIITPEIRLSTFLI